MGMPNPAIGERGRVSGDARGLALLTVEAWDAFLSAAHGIDLLSVGRKDGRTAARTLVVLGSWPEGRTLEHIRADALAGRRDAEPLDDVEARVVQAHVSDARTDIWAALVRSRDGIARWAASPDVEAESMLPVGGPLGVVPMGTLVAAQAYQCAVAALDLAPAGVIAPDTLVMAGLASLIDTVGAVAAQQDAALTLLAITPAATWGTRTLGPNWHTTHLDDAQSQSGPALIGDASTILDIASGRRFAPAVYARGDVKVREVNDLLGVARVLASAPALPGTEGLRTALTAYSSATQVAGDVAQRISGLFRRRG